MAVQAAVLAFVKAYGPTAIKWLIATFGLDAAKGVLERWRSQRAATSTAAEARAMTFQLCRDIDGTWSESVVRGQLRLVVWKDDEPVTAFPDVPGYESAEKLAELPELKHFAGKRRPPPPESQGDD